MHSLVFVDTISLVFLGHNFVDMLDGRFQCLTCSKHVVGAYKGKEHAPHIENILGEIMPVQCDQAGRIPICDKCTRPVTSEEDAFKHDTRFYHLECARCNRCRKKLYSVPCRKLGSALGKQPTRHAQNTVTIIFSSSLSRLFVKQDQPGDFTLLDIYFLPPHFTPLFLLSVSRRIKFFSLLGTIKSQENELIARAGTELDALMLESAARAMRRWTLYLPMSVLIATCFIHGFFWK